MMFVCLSKNEKVTKMQIPCGFLFKLLLFLVFDFVNVPSRVPYISARISVTATDLNHILHENI